MKIKHIAIMVCLTLLVGGTWLVLNKKTPLVSAELDEELAQQPLVVKGVIPAWLHGTLIRNGPVQVSIDGAQNSHWFDGLAMLHAFTLADGHVTYSNRFLRSDAYHKVFDEGSLDYDSFAADPCRSRFRRFFTWFFSSPKNEIKNANINVAKLADQYVALYETPLPVRFDIQTLETLGVLDYADALPKNDCWESAHPHHDAQRQETINFLIDFGRQSYYSIYRLRDGSATREIIASIPVDEPAYMHSFAVTDHYVILTEFPFVVQPWELMTSGKAFIKNFVWKPERGTQFIVIDRKDGHVVGKYTTESFFAFHHANAFEQGNDLILDIVTYKDPAVVMGVADFSRMGDHEVISEDAYPTTLSRYKLSLADGKIHPEVILSKNVEFPRVNDSAYDGKPYSFVYLADTLTSEEIGPLYKVNVETKQVAIWSEKGSIPGEPVFVPAPDAKSEDEGVVLTVILDNKKQKSFLLILDGQSFKEIGRAEVTHKIPAGLHGQYFKK